MYRYIIDGDCNSQLDLSIYAYAINYYPIPQIIKKYSHLINLLTTTNGLAIKNLDYWRGLGITKIDIISKTGHFLHIYSQLETIDKLFTIINKSKQNLLTLYGTLYNDPLQSYR